MQLYIIRQGCAVNIVSVEHGNAVFEAEDRIYYDPSECRDFRTGKPENSK